MGNVEILEILEADENVSKPFCDCGLCLYGKRGVGGNLAPKIDRKRLMTR